jgi:hypothetical protein
MWTFVKQFGLQGFIFGLFGVAFLALAGHADLGAIDWVRAAHWQVTPATVTEIRRTTGVRSGYHYYHHYRYVVEGRAYTGEYHRDNVENTRGDMIEVIKGVNVICFARRGQIGSPFISKIGRNPSIYQRSRPFMLGKPHQC